MVQTLGIVMTCITDNKVWGYLLKQNIDVELKDNFTIGLKQKMIKKHFLINLNEYAANNKFSVRESECDIYEAQEIGKQLAKIGYGDLTLEYGKETFLFLATGAIKKV